MCPWCVHTLPNGQYWNQFHHILCRGRWRSSIQSAKTIPELTVAQISSIQFSCSVMSVQSQLCLTLCNPMDCSTPGLPVHHQLLKFTQTHVHWVGDAIQPSHPLSFPSPASVFPSIRVFSDESLLRIRWPKYWSFSFSISPSNEYSGLISFRRDWLDLLAV